VNVRFDSPRWDWGAAARQLAQEHVRLGAGEAGAVVATVAELELQDGALEVELRVGAERSFHGVVWRVQDARNYESFFVRPHQNGNPDAIQYTPVFNGMSAWQLYHGDEFWSRVRFPVDEWFSIRVAFAADAAEIAIDGERVLRCRLRRPSACGRVGVLVGGDGLLVRGLDYETAPPSISQPPPIEAVAGVVRTWSVSDPVPEASLPEPDLGSVLDQRSWTRLDAEPRGLVDLSRAHPIDGERNTVFAKTVLRAERACVRRLELGFSDRVVVYLGGRALYRGDDSYRSRDYRFLGSIGWFDALYLPLAAGDNELVIAVSEDFGGWGVQARLEDARGLTFAG